MSLKRAVECGLRLQCISSITIHIAVTNVVLIQSLTLCTLSVLLRRCVMTYPKSLLDIRKTYPKAVSDFKKNFFGYQNLPCNMFVCYKYEMFRISQVNVSDITFRISFRISEKFFGFVTTLRLNIHCNCSVTLSFVLFCTYV